MVSVSLRMTWSVAGTFLEMYCNRHSWAGVSDGSPSRPSFLVGMGKPRAKLQAGQWSTA